MNNRLVLTALAMLIVPFSLTAQGKIPSDRDGLLKGEGMGLASVAERNGFPGPKHVLELKEQLRLTPEQVEAAEILVEIVAVEAKALGKEIVGKEEELNAMFTSGSVHEEVLQAKLKEIGRLRADLRRVHLQAHLRMKESLTPLQREHYSKLRGYEIKN
jgi:Spy/CpxP family protein refolding chaperone